MYLDTHGRTGETLLIFRDSLWDAYTYKANCNALIEKFMETITLVSHPIRVIQRVLLFI